MHVIDESGMSILEGEVFKVVQFHVDDLLASDLGMFVSVCLFMMCGCDLVYTLTLYVTVTVW